MSFGDSASRRARLNTVLLIMSTISVLTACPSRDAPPPAPAQATGSAVLRVIPARASVGAIVHVTVVGTTPSTLGVPSELDKWTGDSWRFVYLLLKSTSGEAPRYVKAGTETFYPSAGLPGDRQWPVKIPPDAEPGTYRIRDRVSLKSDSSNEILNLEARLEVVEE